MQRAMSLLIPALLLAAGGCMKEGMASSSGEAAQAPAGKVRQAPTGEAVMMAGPNATARLADANGAARGSAIFAPVDGGLRLTVDAEGLPPGVHGIHIHTVGRCDAPDFTTAGGHWNPAMKLHGTGSPGGPHRGDLPNITIGADGRGHFEATVAGAMLAGGPTPMLDADGASVVIHAAPDDYKTDPSGNSGARIACGVVTPG